MSKLKPIAPFLLLSLALHIVVAWYFYNKKLPTRIKEKQTQAIKSYLVIAPIKKTEQAQLPEPEPIKQEVNKVLIEPVAKTEINEANATFKQTQKERIIEQPVKDLAKHQERELQALATEQNSETPTTPPKRFSAAAAAQNYLNQLQNREIDTLSSQSLSEFRQPKPLNEGFSQSSRKEVIDRMSAKFAAPNSGVKVVAETSHNEKLLSVHGNCFSVKRDENGDEKWLPSTACGYQDPFNGQLQKSLNKYIKKKTSK